MALSSKQQVELQLLISADTQGAIQAANAFKATGQAADDAQRQAFRAGEALQEAFSPRLITSLDGVRAAVLASGQAINQWASSIQGLKGIGPGTTASITDVGNAMIATAQKGEVSEKQLAAFRAQLDAIRRTSPEVANGLSQLDRSMTGLQIQTQGVGSGFTDMQTAGQAMTASFSASQLAAGNLSAGIFGLGFAFLFAGDQFTKMNVKFLGLFAVLSALQIAFTLFQKAQSESLSTSEKATEVANKQAEALDNLRGELELAAEEVQVTIGASVEVGVSVDEVKLQSVIDDMDDATKKIFNTWREEA